MEDTSVKVGNTFFKLSRLGYPVFKNPDHKKFLIVEYYGPFLHSRERPIIPSGFPENTAEEGVLLLSKLEQLRSTRKEG